MFTTIYMLNIVIHTQKRGPLAQTMALYDCNAQLDTRMLRYVRRVSSTKLRQVKNKSENCNIVR